MRKLAILIMTVTIGLCFCEKPETPPKEYYKSIHRPVMQVLENVHTFEQVIYGSEKSAAKKTYDNLVAFNAETLANIEKLPAYGMDNAMRKAAIDLLQFQDAYFTKEFKEALDIFMKSETNEERKAAYDLIDQFYEQERTINAKYEDQVRKFCGKHDLLPKPKNVGA